MQKAVMIKLIPNNIAHTHSAPWQGREEFNINKEEGRESSATRGWCGAGCMYSNGRRPQTSQVSLRG